MDFPGFRRHMLAKHSGKPHETMLVAKAIDELEHALNALVPFGHVFHLEPGPGAPFPEWPRMMFHLYAAPNGRLVRSEYDLWDLGEGWCDSLEEAQIRDGFVHQMRGRGGKQRPGLPAIITKMPSVEEVLAERAKKYRQYLNERNAKRLAQSMEHENGT